VNKPSLLRRVFGGIWNTVTQVRIALTNLLFLALVVGIYFAFAGSAPEPLPEKAALLLNPVGSIVDEKQPVDPLQAVLVEPSPMDHEVLLRDVIEAIDNAAEDPAINSLVMELGGLISAGISRSMEIAAAVQRFKATGKPVIAVGDYYSQSQYLLASHADEVIAHPMGGVALEGFAAYFNYFAEALVKLSVSMHVFRAGKHKSAVEPFLRSDMSPDEKAVTRLWLEDIWQQYAGAVESQRGLSPGAVNAYVNGFAARMERGDGDAAQDALEAGLVDQLLSRSASNDYLVAAVGAANDDGLFEAVPFDHYLSRKRPVTLPASTGDRVAVITAQGDILPGEQPPGTIGGDSLAGLIRETALQDGVRAIVLRVNSGGGSMFASEIIRQQLLEVKASGIPVVVSMGAVAASGGYYIAADADEILATPTPITGSIGVFAAFPTFEKLLQKAGVHTDGVATTSLAGSLRADRPLNDDLKSALNAGIGHAYSKFIDVVAQGRGLSVEEVEAVAQGRVWSAGDALAAGLVDGLGSLEQAVELAAAHAELEDYEVDYVQQALSPSELLFQQLAERVSLPLSPTGDTVSVLLDMARPILDAASEVSALQDPRHLYFRCLACSVVD
jgi:protease IV